MPVYYYKDKLTEETGDFWQDIEPFFQDGTINIVVEVPKQLTSKMEMIKD